MTCTTKKLSGPTLERFFKRFYAAQDGVDGDTATSLAAVSAKTFTSVRIRQAYWRDWQTRNARVTSSRTVTAKTAPQPAKPQTMAMSGSAAPPQSAPPKSAKAGRPGADGLPRSKGRSGVDDAATLDPYVIGLVPTFQREGAEGLRDRLAQISSLEHLRRIARSQQVALPSELKTDDADLDHVRDAMVAAVAKRVADRRAAAGSA